MHDTHEPVIFVVPGDLHLTKPGLENHRTALWVVDEVNHVIRPDFVHFIGDNVQHTREEEFQLFQSLLSSLAVPCHAIVGDHDVKDDPKASGFRAIVGETFGAFSLRGFRFIRLNTQESKPVGLSLEQVRWFRAEVDTALSMGESIVVLQHNYPYQIWEDFAGPGVDAWREIVQTRRITAIVAGHTHYWQIANDGRNVSIATRSIGDPEGGPPGYTLGYLHGNDFAVTYRSIEDRGPLVLITHPREHLLAINPRHVVSGADWVHVRTWSVSPVISARGCIDDGDWFDSTHSWHPNAPSIRCRATFSRRGNTSWKSRS